jgi:hypothetical protein
MRFYSARLLLIALVKGGKPRKRYLYDESIVVYRAHDWNNAFARALEIGKHQETTYENGKGQIIEWKLAEITNLDLIGKKVDGAEVASKLDYKRAKRSIPANAELHPENSKPSQSF